MNRKLVIVLCIIAFHIAALWALQSGLLRRATEQIVSIEILSEVVKPSNPYVSPKPTQPPLPLPPPHAAAPAPVKQPIAPPALPLLTPAPQAGADANQTPSPKVPPGGANPGTAAAPVGTPIVEAPSSAASVELPSSDANYLHNPKAAYPRLSQQRDEQGKVLVHVQIDVDGRALQAEIKQSSGFDRLDQAALNAALGWRYVPGKRAGVPEIMWTDVPISFVIE
jgi:protein TonB